LNLFSLFFVLLINVLNFGYCIVFTARGRFAPKAKPKPPPPQKNVSAISSKDVNNVNVTSSSSTTHKESQLISPKNDSHNADIDVNNGELCYSHCVYQKL
jgi:hypothetical protein